MKDYLKNPCPCGNYGSDSKICLCSARSIEQYWKKFSAPLLDRVDLRIQVSNENNEETNTGDTALSTNELRKNIAKAVLIQRKRQAKKNSKLLPEEIAQFCKLDQETTDILNSACQRYDFSPRARASCLKTARTIADMTESPSIKPEHMEEAISFRKAFNDFMNMES